MLVRVGSDGEPVPSSAEKWKAVSPTVIDVTLRKGMRWHDGKPVTVEDVKFTYDYYKKWKIAYYLGALEPINDVKILNNETVRFTLKEPYAPILIATFSRIMLLPKHIWENVVEQRKLKSPEEWENPHPIGNGPFKFVHWRRGEELVCDRFDDYFSPSKFSKLIAKKYSNKDGLFLGLLKGDIDINFQDLLPSQVNEGKQNKDLTMVLTGDFGVNFLFLNQRKAPSSDRQFLRAIAYTINRDLIVEIMQGYAEKGVGWIAPENRAWHNKQIKPHEYSLEKARKILTDAGYEWDSDGRLYYPAKK